METTDNYKSKYSGTQIDNAVDLALSVPSILQNYIKVDDIGKTVAGLTEGFIDVSVIPKADIAIPGVVSIGSGLRIKDGTLSISSTDWCSREAFDQEVKNTMHIDQLSNYSLTNFNNDLLEFQQLSEIGGEIAEYELIIK